MMKKILIIWLMTFSTLCLAAPQKLTVVLDWFPNPDHAPLIIAKELGLFKQQGLDVELIGPADPTDPPKWVAAGKADIGITYEPQLMQQIDQGLPLIRVGTLIDQPLSCIVSLQSSGIHTLADLKGKRIAASSGELSSTVLKALLRNQQLSNQDVELTNVRYNITQALLSGKVDAATGMMRNFEIPQLESTGQKVTIFLPEDYGIPTYDELVFITNTAHQHDKRIPRFLAAIKKAVEYLDAHPEESWQLYVKAYPESNNKINHDAWLATMPYFAENPASFDSKEWEKFAEFMQQNKLIKKIQPINRYAVEVA